MWVLADRMPFRYLLIRPSSSSVQYLDSVAGLYSSSKIRAYSPLLVGLVVVAVLGDLVDEEQRQHLDALGEERLLLLEVRLDRLADLDAADGRFVDVAGRLAGASAHARW